MKAAIPGVATDGPLEAAGAGSAVLVRSTAIIQIDPVVKARGFFRRADFTLSVDAKLVIPVTRPFTVVLRARRPARADALRFHARRTCRWRFCALSRNTLLIDAVLNVGTTDAPTPRPPIRALAEAFTCLADLVFATAVFVVTTGLPNE